MEKRISYDAFMAAKRIAQACNTPRTKRDNIKKKILKLEEEYKGWDTQIQALEAGIKQLTGFRVEDLVQKVIEPAVREDGTPQLDVNGRPVKTTKYIPTEIVSYDKKSREYVITVPDLGESDNIDNSNNNRSERA